MLQECKRSMRFNLGSNGVNRATSLIHLPAGPRVHIFNLSRVGAVVLASARIRVVSGAALTLVTVLGRAEAEEPSHLLPERDMFAPLATPGMPGLDAVRPMTARGITLQSPDQPPSHGGSAETRRTITLTVGYCRLRAST